MTAEDIMLTTKDNKFNPFTDEDLWRDYDTDMVEHPPYNTEAYYTRLLGLRDPEDFSTASIAEELAQIFEEIIEINKEIGNDIYVIITRDGKILDHVPRELLMKP